METNQGRPSSAEGCGGSCGESSACEGCAAFQPADLPHDIKHVIAIASGKGGVGKSSATVMLANALKKQGLKVGIMDADITGPSIPRLTGLHKNAVGDGQFIVPEETADGVKVMSVNLLLEDENAPVVWRGPIISNLLKQFWNEVAWGELDVLLIDMPPGTGDVPITIYQTIPVDGIIMVSTPQQLAGMIVRKAIGMAEIVEIPVFGLIENMAYYECPECGHKIEVFGSSNVDNLAQLYQAEVIARLPVQPEISTLGDQGRAHEISSPEMEAAAKWIVDKKINL